MSVRLQVVGDPIEHSLSPQIHHLFATEFGDDVSYGKEQVPFDLFNERAEAFRASGGLGMNVTVPLKTAAFAYVRHLDQVTRAAGAVNTIHFCDGKAWGYNTDGWGLVADLTLRWGVSLQDQTIVILGAGGATRGVVLPLLEAGAGEIVIANRTAAKAHALCAELSTYVSGVSGGNGQIRACGLSSGDAIEDSVGLVVNATSVGLSDDQMTLPLTDQQLAEAFCYDMGYGANAGFLRQVQSIARGAADGLGMLVEQAACSYEIWLGHKPSTEPVYQQLRAEVDR